MKDDAHGGEENQRDDSNHGRRKPRPRAQRDATVRTERTALFRVPTLSHFQSYSRIPAVLEECVLEALRTRKRLEHTLMHGHPGTGKSLLSHALVRDFAPPQAIELDARRGTCPESLWHCIQIVGNGGVLIVRHIDELDPMSTRMLEATLDPRLRVPNAPMPSALRTVILHTNPYARRRRDIDRLLADMNDGGGDHPLDADEGEESDEKSADKNRPNASGDAGADDSTRRHERDPGDDGDEMEVDIDPEIEMRRRRRSSTRAALGMQGLPVPKDDADRRRLAHAWQRVPAFTLVATTEDSGSIDRALLGRFERKVHLRIDAKALRTVLLRALRTHGLSLASDAIPIAEAVLGSVLDATEPLIRAIVTRARIEKVGQIDVALLRSIVQDDLPDILPDEHYARSLLAIHSPQQLVRAGDVRIEEIASRLCWSHATVRGAIRWIEQRFFVEQLSHSFGLQFGETPRATNGSGAASVEPLHDAEKSHEPGASCRDRPTCEPWGGEHAASGPSDQSPESTNGREDGRDSIAPKPEATTPDGAASRDARPSADAAPSGETEPLATMRDATSKQSRATGESTTAAIAADAPSGERSRDPRSIAVDALGAQTEASVQSAAPPSKNEPVAPATPARKQHELDPVIQDASPEPKGQITLVAPVEPDGPRPPEATAHRNDIRPEPAAQDGLPCESTHNANEQRSFRSG